MARWRSENHRRDHFREHGPAMGCRTIEAYDASAQDTLLVGRYFEFYDDDAGEQRVGCFDQTSGRFVVLDDDDRIVSHFLTHVGYIRWLPFSNYDDGVTP